jgi:ribonuclease R
MQARLKRGTLELDLPERKVEIAKDGSVKAIKSRERLDSHRLIEDVYDRGERRRRRAA